jgi:hypothetical protein
MDIEQRLERLERENRRLKVAVLLAVALVGVTVVVGLLPAVRVLPDDTERGIELESLRRAYRVWVATTVEDELAALLPLFDGLHSEVSSLGSEAERWWVFEGRFDSAAAAKSFCERVPITEISSPTWDWWNDPPCTQEIPGKWYPRFFGSVANQTDEDYEARAWCRVRSDDGLIERDFELMLFYQDGPFLGAVLSFEDDWTPNLRPLAIEARHRVPVVAQADNDPCTENGVVEVDFSLLQ